MPDSTSTSFELQVLFSVGPWLALLGGCLLALWIIARCMRLHVHWGVLKQLHADQKGGVQSLSFVLTVPLFIFIMLFIVQLSQITIGQIGVEYAAFAAARSAIVWIPARASSVEGEMQIGSGLQLVELVAYNGDDEIDLDLNAYIEFGLVPDGTTHIYAVYEVAPGGVKYEKIRSAAALALMNICPSRSVVTSNTSASSIVGRVVNPLNEAYVSLAPAESDNPKIEHRLRNKLTYALEHTDIQIEIRHKDSTAFLAEHDLLPDRYEFRMNEIDWQDQVIVDVIHEFALLPGPGRLLARAPQARPGTEVDESYANGQAADEVGARIQQRHDRTYVWPLQASARLTVEGFKPYFIDQQPPAAVQPFETQTSPGLQPW
jgi:hypothetical protein